MSSKIFEITKAATFDAAHHLPNGPAGPYTRLHGHSFRVEATVRGEAQGAIGWVSDLIEVAGGRDVFAELRDRRSARERVVPAADVVARDPQIILASWCGKPLDAAAIAARPGWDRIAAVAAGEIHEIPGEDVLSPGPSLVQGLRRIHEIVQAIQAR